MESSAVHQQGRLRRVVRWAAIVGALLLLVPVYQFDRPANGDGLCVINANAAEAMSPRDDTDARAAFLAAYTVFMHPRCMNCHPAGDVPLQGEDSHPHAQNVKRGPNGKGKYALKCANCHQETNLPGENMPPGNPNWHLPPPTMRMVFEGKSPGDLCAQLKDPRQNGGKTLEQLIHHVSEDKLVLGGWDPGDGRSTPLLSHAEFVQKMRAWVNEGAPCPE